MSSYDKTIAISREEEGTYHRREVEPRHYSSKPATTYHTERYLVEEDSRPVVRHKSASGKPGRELAAYSSDEADNFEEWTTSKRKVNHKTRQVETRVSRQLLVENGKVIADSGPQVTTRIKEDNKEEECEKEKTPKNKGKFAALENAPEGPEGACNGRVLGEKKEIQRVTREVREENMQYHDERLKELTGRDVHQRAIKAPHELIAINEQHHSADSAPRGKMVHYSNKGKKYKDTDEILEVAKLAIDGSITKEVKRTHNHEEFSEDEKPDETGEAEELRAKPIVQRSSRRHVDYVNDYDDLRTPDTSDNDEREEFDSRGRPIVKSKSGRVTGGRRSGSGQRSARREDDDEAFPRYELDPLLNSLRDEDFKPAASQDFEHRSRSRDGSGVRHVKEHSLERRRYASSSDDDAPAQRRSRTHQSPAGATSQSNVEIPEEYRVNRQRLLAGKSSGGRGTSSPVRSSSRTSPKQSHGRNQRKEDAAVQAHLTDEEIERRSLASSQLSGGARTQAKTTQHLQRQSTPNASRRYYYGNAATANTKPVGVKSGAKRRDSVSSSSSASSVSLTDARAKQRQQGTRSRDSGFRSPQSARTETPLSDHKRKQQQIYSVSSKSKSGRDKNDRIGATSPTPTTGSLGQRSVKTTTTTLSAGLADRPLSRNERAARAADKAKADKLRHDDDNALEHEHDEEHEPVKRFRKSGERRALDTISVSSLNGPNATKIRVPYRHVIEIQRTAPSHTSQADDGQRASQMGQNDENNAVERTSSEMSFQEDIESLSKRLANISQKDEAAEQSQKHFDYKTVVANIQSAPAQANQIVGAYNVQLKQNSPFQQKIFVENSPQMPAVDQLANYENDFSPNEYYIKYRATPALVNESDLLTNKPSNGLNEDSLSQTSSCSLHSFKTYKIRTINQNSQPEQPEIESPVEEPQLADNVEFDENGNSKRPAAWIFDPRDGSSTAIVPPVRPKKPEAPEVDSKTEELVQSRGGRSYYLEIMERPVDSSANSKTTGSMNSLYSRWNSQGALNSNSANPKPNNFTYRPLSYANGLKPSYGLHKSTKQLNSAIAQLEQNRNKVDQHQKSIRRQLPFGGSPSSLGDKSKSSSCLLTVTKPSKYSIYGGFKKPGDTSKPVPRLSYSRAIGPRSQRVDSLPKTPSRYLKMR